MDASSTSSPFVLHPGKKTALLVDGMHAYSITRALSREIDFKRLREHFDQRTRLHYAKYVSFYISDPAVEYHPLKRLIDFLELNGWRTHLDMAIQYQDHAGRQRIVHNLHGIVAVDVYEAAITGIEHLILFASDSNFAYAVEKAQAQGAKVTVLSARNAGVATVADELRRAADHFVDLADPSVGDLFARDRDTRDRDTGEMRRSRLAMAQDRRPTIGDAVGMTDHTTDES